MLPNRARVIVDRIEIGHQDIDRARRLAVERIRYILEKEVGIGAPRVDRAVVVTDADQRVLLEIPFSAALN